MVELNREGRATLTIHQNHSTEDLLIDETQANFSDLGTLALNLPDRAGQTVRVYVGLNEDGIPFARVDDADSGQPVEIKFAETEADEEW